MCGISHVRPSAPFTLIQNGSYTNLLFLQMISDWKGLRRAFRKMDSLGDGFVSVTDFKAAMYRFNFPLNEEDFFHIFSVFDENMEGRISYVEFMRRSLSE